MKLIFLQSVIYIREVEIILCTGIDTAKFLLVVRDWIDIKSNMKKGRLLRWWIIITYRGKKCIICVDIDLWCVKVCSFSYFCLALVIHGNFFFLQQCLSYSCCLIQVHNTLKKNKIDYCDEIIYRLLLIFVFKQLVVLKKWILLNLLFY